MLTFLVSKFVFCFLLCKIAGLHFNVIFFFSRQKQDEYMCVRGRLIKRQEFVNEILLNVVGC